MLDGCRARVVSSLAPVNVVVGHYGVGKTNLSLNLAVDAAREGYKVVLADLDVVNPYFRSSEYRVLLEDAGVRVVAPVFSEAGTSLDTPSITGVLAVAVESAYEAHANGLPREIVIVDAGGDDAGAFALARFAPVIAAGPHEVLFVVNQCRNLTQTPEEAFSILREIENASHLKATAVANNTHLQEQTTLDLVAQSAPFAQEVAALAGIPLRFTAVAECAFRQENGAVALLETASEVYPVKMLVSPPWVREATI